MKEKFKKGQIIPRRLSIALSQHKKSQHSLVFGCDVMIDKRNIHALSDGCAIMVFNKGQRMNNGTFKNSSFRIENVYFWGEGYENCTGLKFNK